ncbi:MAG: DoxX family protein, partial [Sphingobacteriales bacterium]
AAAGGSSNIHQDQHSSIRKSKKKGGTKASNKPPSTINGIEDFMNFLGLGPTLSLGLVVFAEFFCSVFLILGLFTRVVVVVLAIAMLVAILKAHNGDIFGDGEHGSLFLAGYLAILLVGPGKASLDGILGK